MVWNPDESKAYGTVVFADKRASEPDLTTVRAVEVPEELTVSFICLQICRQQPSQGMRPKRPQMPRTGTAIIAAA